MNFFSKTLCSWVGKSNRTHYFCASKKKEEKDKAKFSFFDQTAIFAGAFEKAG
jgi:hypothetical protein